jgi:hypothetical protein
MKIEKGDAAFDSADDVLAKRIINTTEKHGQDEGPSNLDAASDYSFDEENQDVKKNSGVRGRTIIIAACIGIVLLVIGLFMFRRRK